MIQKTSTRKKEIVCIIPTLNECDTVVEVIRKARQFTPYIVVVDGHSKDDTCDRAKQAGADIIYQEGKGKGWALRTAFKQVHSDIYVTIDGDATYDARELINLVQPIIDDRADMVVGSRLKGCMEPGSISKVNKIGNNLFNFLINHMFNGEISDSQSGFRAITDHAVRQLNLTSHDFEVETEITIKALKAGLRIKEIPISYSRRRGTKSKLNSFKDGSRILKTILAAI
jgi:glycosyltransferase involved in cell wall biosynthesis